MLVILTSNQNTSGVCIRLLAFVIKKLTMITDVVWPETKQIMIIDSIFRNFYIPPVIFAVKVHDDGSETKTCIDGKQRLTSIHRYENVSFMSFTGTNVGLQKGLWMEL